MSFFCYLSGPRYWVLAADNKKNVLTVKTAGDGRFTTQELTIGDAHKIHPLGGGWWMTGAGLSAVLYDVREHVREALEGARRGTEPPDSVIGRLAGDPDWVRQIHRRCAAALKEGLPAGWETPEVLSGLQEIVFTGFDASACPVVLRTGSDNSFTFRRRSGPAVVGFEGENGVWDGALEEKIRLYLTDVAEDLQRRDPSSMGDRAWDLIPPLFQKLAKAFPHKLSAHGDLVCLTPEGHRWFLF